MKTKLIALEALKLALPHINPKSIDGVRVQAEPIADCYVNTIVSTAIAALEADITKPSEPVGKVGALLGGVSIEWAGKCPSVGAPLYTTPQEPAAAELLEALKRIESWNEHSAEFSMDYGSNGVRDFYRGIARVAISKASWSAS